MDERSRSRGERIYGRLEGVTGAIRAEDLAVSQLIAAHRALVVGLPPAASLLAAAGEDELLVAA
jgi:hypothetical protein